jgi:hypothetical protein
MIRADSAVAQAANPPTAQPNEHRLAATVKFFTGAGVALVLHESGHLAFDVMFDAQPSIKRVNFGPFPFFAITHRPDLSPRREFAVSSAGFWVQEAGDEWLLTTRSDLRTERAPYLKGLLAFNALTSIGYATVAFAKAGPAERDTRGMSASIAVNEPIIGLFVLAPAILDGFRYYRPQARWARWASRGAKASSVLLILKSRPAR